jgi:hypothetical protein
MSRIKAVYRERGIMCAGEKVYAFFLWPAMRVAADR